ncbi:MAG: aromatic ring-hydroxylating dioxygenase subunit alpha, partial [Nitrospinae bacterium]|nr:aromatic ring-hydroxylating dioxygenase subunit alpha [Nitrospinota bacterium]
APTTHQRYFGFLLETGVDPGALQRRRAGLGKSLGNGHALIETEPLGGRPIARWAPMFGEARKAELEVVRRQLEERFGIERAYRMTQTSRNLLIFPNLIINDIMAITVRTFFPVTPEYMEITAWALAPSEESPENRALRLDNFLTFLGPGGYATPDDVEMLEACQRGFANREVEWSDISRGMKREQPLANDELQMRAFWRKWHELIMLSQTAHAPARPAVAV